MSISPRNSLKNGSKLAVSVKNDQNIFVRFLKMRIFDSKMIRNDPEMTMNGQK